MIVVSYLANGEVYGGYGSRESYSSKFEIKKVANAEEALRHMALLDAEAKFEFSDNYDHYIFLNCNNFQGVIPSVEQIKLTQEYHQELCDKAQEDLRKEKEHREELDKKEELARLRQLMSKYPEEVDINSLLG